jgi:SAM-dependent methyltransferase
MAPFTTLDPAAAAYDAVAPFYDEFTAGYAYEPWIDAIEQRARALGLSGHRALDLACGTGKSTLPLLVRGYNVQGCDISEAMVTRAREKLPDLADAFSVADMRDLPHLGEFDFVLCLDDAINYLLGDDDLESTFAGVERMLAPGGIFAFDVNTLLTYRTSFAETAVSERPGMVFIWRGEADSSFGPGEGASATIEVFAEAENQLWERHVTRHLQRHHPRSAVCAALDRAGLTCRAVFGQHRGGILDARSDEQTHIKLVYFAQRQDNYPAWR